MKVTCRLADPEEMLVVDWDARDQRRAEMQAPKLLGLPVGTKLETIAASYPTNYMSVLFFAAAVRAGWQGDWNTWSARFVDGDDVEDGGSLPDPTPPAP